MAFGIQHKFENGMHHVGGTVDEHADFQMILTDTSPVLKLNFKGIKWINSLGVRKLVSFAQGLGNRPVEFHELPPVVVEAVNVLPLIVGGQSYVHRVRSVSMPMTCSGQHPTEIAIAIADLYANQQFTLPDIPCPVCKMPLVPDIDTDLDDYLFFLTLGT